MPLRLSKRKNSPNWYLRGSVRGVPVEESTGTDDRETADAIRIQREAQILQHSVFGKRATVTWLEASVSYMEHDGDHRFLGRLNEYFGAKILLTDVDQDAIERAADALYPSTKNSTKNRQVYTPISAVLKRAAKRGWCEGFEIQRPKEGKTDFRYFTPVEFEALLLASSSHLVPLLVFLVYTGARLSEALYLDWENVHMDQALVTFKNTKNDETRSVPLHPRVVEVLRKSNRPSPRVFLTDEGVPYVERRDKRGRLVAGGQIKTAFGNAVRRAGIKHATPHDCRHTFASWTYAQTRDLLGLKRLGGWKTLKMVERYAHVNVDDLKALIEALPWEKSGNSETDKPKKQRKSRA